MLVQQGQQGLTLANIGINFYICKRCSVFKLIPMDCLNRTLLQIFPNKAHGLKQTDIYKQLTAIREFRNRIAHHEPICFNSTRTIDTSYAKEHYELIRTYIEYMGFDSDSVLRMVEKPDSILKVIDGMK